MFVNLLLSIGLSFRIMFKASWNVLLWVFVIRIDIMCCTRSSCFMILFEMFFPCFCTIFNKMGKFSFVTNCFLARNMAFMHCSTVSSTFQFSIAFCRWWYIISILLMILADFLFFDFNVVRVFYLLFFALSTTWF